MQDFIRVLILLVLGAIVVSLGSALLHLSRGGRGSEEESRKLSRALTVRIALSLVLFLLLMLAWRVGLIAPHDLK
ncbi:MAG TPA: twin transmembrane helix small protein [Steroidobacteraceae bacterium]|nr:twin transmembrane helix small protein [Steroidobacteraceae bacterium]